MKIPIIETYRGVGIHDFQGKTIIEQYTKPGIDAVHDLSDPELLFKYACNDLNPPEARLFAGDKLRAIAELRAASHGKRIAVDEKMLRAVLSGLDSLNWADHLEVGTLLQAHDPGQLPVRPPEERARLEVAREEAHRVEDAARRAAAGLSPLPE